MSVVDSPLGDDSVTPAWGPFLGIVVLAYVIPGPDFAVIVRATTNSRRSGALAAVGAQTGLSVHMVAAAIGLSLLLARSNVALTVIQVIGAAYLIYLGIRAVLTDSSDAQPSLRGGRSDRTWFIQGLLTNLLNPKAILFFVSILPQFVGRDGPLPLQILTLGVVDIVVGVTIWTVLITVASRVAAALHKPGRRQLWDRVTGSIFIVIGLTLGLTQLIEAL